MNFGLWLERGKQQHYKYQGAGHSLEEPRAKPGERKQAGWKGLCKSQLCVRQSLIL